MAGTITPNLTDISLCEADDWDGGVGALDADSQIQGSNCLTITYTGAGLRAETTKTITSANFVTLGYPVIYGWLTFARLAMLETYTNGGLRFIVKSSSTAWSAWKVAGSDTAATAGWSCYAIRTNQPPDYIGTTAADLTAITQIGWIVNLSIKGIVKWDAFRYGTGLTMTTGTLGAPCTWDDIWAAENDPLKKYGIVTKYEGAFFVQGKLNFGDTGSGDTYFKDTSQIIIFKSARVDAASVTTTSRARSGNVATIVTAAAHLLAVGDGVRISGLGGSKYNGDWVVASIPNTTTFTYANTGGDEGTTGDTGGTVVGVGYYEIKVQGGSGSNKVFFGTKSGTAGISGLIFKAAGTSKYKLTATDTNITDLGLYGCTFIGADRISLPLNATTKEVLNSTFESCAKMIPSTCLMKNCNFIFSVSDAMLISNDPFYVMDSNFISCTRGIEIDTVGDGTYGFDDLVFSDTGWFHVNNTSGSALIVAKGGTSNPSTYTGSAVTFTGSVTLSVTVVDGDNNNSPIENAQCAIYKSTTPFTQFMNEDTLAGGTATELYTGSTPTAVIVRIRKSSTPDVKYIPYDTSGTIIALTGYSLTAVMRRDILA